VLAGRLRSTSPGDDPYSPLTVHSHARHARACCAWASVPAVDADASAPISSINEERLRVGRALVEVQSTDWPSALAYYTDDIEYHDPIVDVFGIGAMTQFLARMFASSPDLVTTIEDETCVNGIYTAAWTMAGQFSGVPYTAKGMSILKFRPKEARAYYQRDYYTGGDIMLNIPGLAEPTQAFRAYYRCAVDPAYPCPF
jgi:hypothetical protein